MKLYKLLLICTMALGLLNCADGENDVARERALQQKTKLCFPGNNFSGDTCLLTKSLELMVTPEHYSYPFVEQSKFSFDYTPPNRFVDLLYVGKDDQLSPNFKVREFMSFRKGRYGIVQPKLIYALEAIRKEVKKPLTITSGFRSPYYNSQIVNAARFSRHMYGDAVDFKVSGANKADLKQLCLKHGATFVQVYKTHMHCDWRKALSIKPDHLHDEQEGELEESLNGTSFDEDSEPLI